MTPKKAPYTVKKHLPFEVTISMERKNKFIWMNKYSDCMPQFKNIISE